MRDIYEFMESSPAPTPAPPHPPEDGGTILLGLGGP